MKDKDLKRVSETYASVVGFVPVTPKGGDGVFVWHTSLVPERVRHARKSH